MPEYVNEPSLNLWIIPHPGIFFKPLPQTSNSYLKIAVFGEGYSPALYLLNKELTRHKIVRDYEIRIIGMHGSSIWQFSHVTRPIKRRLTRQEMESLVPDIDMFLILYPKNSYMLSCSSSIFEAYSYGKPVLYLENFCIDSFNPKDAPIGIACGDIEDMAAKFTDMVNNYDSFKEEIYIFRKNIYKNREKIDIKHTHKTLKEIFG